MRRTTALSAAGRWKAGVGAPIVGSVIPAPKSQGEHMCCIRGYFLNSVNEY
jgi:hypothetical protein